MASSATRSTTAPTSATRLVGLDVARCLALLGMVATHVLEERAADGSLTTVQAIAGGRASALFAVLAGVSLALVSGRRTPLAGAPLQRARAAIAVRAVLIALVGLVLGMLSTNIAIILTYYGVTFLLVLPFLGLRARPLLYLALGWAVVVPVVSLVVRPMLPDRQFASPAFDQLADPGRLLAELMLTGYYPAVPWMAYLLLGMAIGRLDLGSRMIQSRLFVAGLATALLAAGVSGVLTALAGFTPADLDLISTGMFGQTPTDDPRWLLVVAPHSTTPFDLLQTGCSACVAIGACLLVVGVLPRAGARMTAVIFGAGTMTLTLYCVHVVMRTPEIPPTELPSSMVWHVLVLVWIGAAFVALGRRGPLERAVGALPRLIRG